MAITTKKPAEKLTVGAQYICFDTASDGTYSGTYAEDVTCLPTVTQVEVTDTGDDFKDYASGDVYASGNRTMYKQIKTTNLAFEDALIAKMKGDVVDDTSGVIMESGYNRRPYFAYGIYAQKDDGTLDLRWYPKVQHTENSDSTATSEESHKTQTDDLTMNAYGFDAAKTKCVRRIYKPTDTADAQKVIAAWFAAPILTDAAAKAIKAGT